MGHPAVDADDENPAVFEMVCSLDLMRRFLDTQKKTAATGARK